jgi:hypothetical protein
MYDTSENHNSELDLSINSSEIYVWKIKSNRAKSNSELWFSLVIKEESQ